MKVAEHLLGGLILTVMFFIMALVYGVRVEDVSLVMSTLKIMGVLLLVLIPVGVYVLADQTK